MRKLPIIYTHWPFSKYRRMARLKAAVLQSITKVIIIMTCLAFTSCKKIECKPEPKRPELSYPVDRNPQIPNIPAPKGGHHEN